MILHRQGTQPRLIDSSEHSSINLNLRKRNSIETIRPASIGREHPPDGSAASLTGRVGRLALEDVFRACSLAVSSLLRRVFLSCSSASESCDAKADPSDSFELGALLRFRFIAPIQSALVQNSLRHSLPM